MKIRNILVIRNFYNLTLLKLSIIVFIFLISVYSTISIRNNISLTLQSNEIQNLQIFYSDTNNHSEKFSKLVNIPKGKSIINLKILKSNVNFIRVDLDKNSKLTLNSIKYKGLLSESSCSFENYLINDASVVKSDSGINIIGIVDRVDPYIDMSCQSNYSSKRLIGSLAHFILIASIISVIIGLFFANKFKIINSNLYNIKINLSIILNLSLKFKYLIGFFLIFLFTIISANQVIFNNKSFIAPLGTSLIYSDNPSIPNYKYERIYDYHGSDTGATMWQHIPYTYLAGNAIINDHELPLWNRFNGGGRSLIGQGQAMIFEPINLLIALTGFETWKYDLKYIFLKFIFAISISLILYFLNCSFFTSLLIGVLSIFSTFYFFRLNHPGYFTYAYSPLVLLSYLFYINSRSIISDLGSILLLILSNYLLLNSGTGKEAYLSLIVYNIIGFSFFYAFNFRYKRYIIPIIGFLIFTLISAPIWLAFWDYISSQKSGYSSPGAVQFKPSDFIFYSENLGFLSIGGYNPSVNFPIFYLFIASYIFYFKYPNFRSKLNSILLLSTSLLLFLSYGLIPVFFIIAVPYLNSVGHINDVFSFIAIVPTMILAGLAFNFITKNSFIKRDFNILLIISILFLLLPIIFSNLSNYKTFIIFSIFYLLSLVSFNIFIIITCNSLKTKQIKIGHTILASLIFLLFIVRSIQFPGYDLAEIKNYVFVPSPSANLRPNIKLLNEFSNLTKDLPSRAIGVEGTMFSGYRAIYGIESIDGPDALFPKYFRVLSEELSLPYDWYWRMRFNNSNIIQNSNILDFLNVGYIFSESNSLGIKEKNSDDDQLVLIKREAPWPRSFFTSCFNVMDDNEALIAIKNNLSKSNKIFLILDAKSFENLEFKYNSDCSRSNEIIIPTKYTNTSNTSTINIITDRPGFLYLGENFELNNFSVNVDGVASKIIRSNFAFKSVYIPNGGPHSVTFSYTPKIFMNSLIISYLGLLLLTILVIFFIVSYLCKFHFLRNERFNHSVKL
jgi:hypothetical protein